MSEQELDAMNTRLEQADAEDSAESQAEGKQAGAEWAQYTARPAQLRRLWDFWPQQWINDLGSALYCAMEPRGRVSGEDFWKNVFGDDWQALTEDEDFMEGFADGAMEVYGQAQNHARDKANATAAK